MSIIIDCKSDRVEIKIVNGPNWSTDLARIKSINGRKYDGETKRWVVHASQIGELLNTWTVQEIVFSGTDSRLIVDRFKHKEAPRELTSLAPITQMLPETFMPLKWYQDKFVKLNPSCTRVLLSLVQGAGKSLASLERVKALAHVGTVPWKRILIVCPKRVRRNWRKNVQQVLGSESVIFWDTTKKRRDKIRDAAAAASVVICTYETVKELHDYTGVDYDHLIVDEAHLLAHADSRRARHFQSVNDRYGLDKPIMLLTGTPIQDKPSDLWNLVNILDPQTAGNYYAWVERYTRVLASIKKPIPVRRNGVIQRNEAGSIIYKMTDIPIKTATQNIPDLQRRLGTCMFRVAAEDIFDFEHVIEPIYIEMYPEQRRLYEQLRDDLLVEIAERTITLGQVPTRMLRLLQACEGIFNFTADNKISSKLDFIKEEIEDLGDEQLIVWSRFQPITFEIQKLFPEQAVVFNGAMSDDMNQLAVWAFNGVTDKQDLEEFKVLAKKNNFQFGPGEAKIFTGVVDLKSSLGIDLHEMGCARQMFSSFSLMPAVNDQAGARITRQGQRKALVKSQYPMCEDTIEPEVLAMVLEKWKTTLQILDGNESISYQQSRDLVKILSRK